MTRGDSDPFDGWVDYDPGRWPVAMDARQTWESVKRERRWVQRPGETVADMDRRLGTGLSLPLAAEPGRDGDDAMATQDREPIHPAPSLDIASSQKPATPERPCRLCGAPLVFLPNAATGSPLPLDAATGVVYAVFSDGRGDRWAVKAADWLWELNKAPTEAAKLAHVRGLEGFAVNHMQTCTDELAVGRRRKRAASDATQRS